MVKQKVILGFLVILSIFIFACNAQEDVNTINLSQQDSNSDSSNDDLINDDNVIGDDINNNVNDDIEDLEGEVKTFYVEGGPMFEFYVNGERNADIIVNVGDTVIIEFESVGGMPHDWIVDEFENARTEVLSQGELEIIEFVVDTRGTFEYYCSVGQHRANGMVGNFIVQ